MQHPRLTLLAIVSFYAERVVSASCKASTIRKALPDLLGVEIKDVKAEEVLQWNEYATSAPTVPFLPVQPKPIDFCDVTVTYGHNGHGDEINVKVWLPLKDEDWNGRFLGQGGLGWAAGNVGALAGGVGMGYATADSDTGHTYNGHPADVALSSTSWAFTGKGNVNLHALQNFGYRALEELTLLAKSVTETYYAKDIAYSYWQGCSTGGRQGLTMAQRFPTLYNGILAAAPAINWVTFLITEYYAHVRMSSLNYHPPACELLAIRDFAITACDDLDGVRDGIIAAPGDCTFSPFSVVGEPYTCDGEDRKITPQAAEIAAVVWSGPNNTDGNPIWYGLSPDSLLPGADPLYKGLARTTCSPSSTDASDCKSDPFPISADWIRNWILRDPSYDLSSIDTDSKFLDILKISQDEYHSLMDSAIPDLRTFKSSGGKILTWHGLADQLIPPNGTIDYHERVAAASTSSSSSSSGGGGIKDFMRHFEVPGLAHCFGGPGPFPLTAFNSLVEWVEKGVAPEKLGTVQLPGMDGSPPEVVRGRVVCAWPRVGVWDGVGDVNEEGSWRCEEGFPGGLVGGEGGGHDEL
ncbi:unnamed protein product [Zymoseptoria tritici ST99CH_3D7]|uniref:Carboxylic ester hydrolase n=1 Tax=Zymoseptoria tritici (strain ST99CH_3D7) TaxID=1276538 RepID=A0A1X7S6W5_ZYMT9|nr:unnamed protein product [Zymoseptoria tritici ST99CH_3D7]